MSSSAPVEQGPCSLAYRKDKAASARATSAFSFLLTTGFLATGAFSRIDGLANLVLRSFFASPLGCSKREA